MNHSDDPQVQITEFVIAYIKSIGLPTAKLEFRPLPGDGSRRLFWRITTPKSGTRFIAMENVPTDTILERENFAYLKIGTHLFQKGLPVPEIHRFDLTNGWFIMEDMGDNSLQEAVSSQKSRIPLYERVVEILFRLQIEGPQGFDAKWCYQTQRFDHSVMRRYEADYFRDAFLCHYLGMKKDWPELEVPFNHLADTASKADNHFFLHRDFQAKNIMVTDGKIGILDWQGGRLGPLPYDLASLLIDPYTSLSAHEKNQIYQYYLQLLGDYQPAWIDPFKRYFPYLAIQRNLQILGAFSYLTKVGRKPYFEAYISPALKSLHGLLHEVGDPKLSPLKNLLNSLPNFK
jgi:aminoglycoside/choline kinase family phosphotransferase